MARRRRRKNVGMSSGVWRKLMASMGAKEWHRPPSISLNGGLNGGTAEQLILMTNMRGEELEPTRFTPLSSSRRLNPVVKRLILRVTMAAINVVVPGLIEYFWGLRVLESANTGVTFTAGQVGSVFMNDTTARERVWLTRGQGLMDPSATNPFAVVQSMGSSPESGIYRDLRMNVELDERHVLVYHHGWRTAGSSATPPDAAVTGSLTFEANLWLPR